MQVELNKNEIETAVSALRYLANSGQSRYESAPELCDRLSRMIDQSGSILQRAHDIVYNRSEEKYRMYGDMTDSLKRIAEMVNLIKGTTLTAEHVCWMLIFGKLVREGNAHKEDNLLDATAYIAALNNLADTNCIAIGPDYNKIADEMPEVIEFKTTTGKTIYAPNHRAEETTDVQIAPTHRHKKKYVLPNVNEHSKKLCEEIVVQ